METIARLLRSLFDALGLEGTTLAYEYTEWIVFGMLAVIVFVVWLLPLLWKRFRFFAAEFSAWQRTNYSEERQIVHIPPEWQPFIDERVPRKTSFWMQILTLQGFGGEEQKLGYMTVGQNGIQMFFRIKGKMEYLELPYAAVQDVHISRRSMRDVVRLAVGERDYRTIAIFKDRRDSAQELFYLLQERLKRR
jgi:hypothetical protein